MIQNEVSESHDQTELSFSLAAPSIAKDSTAKNPHLLSSSHSLRPKCITDAQKVVRFGALSVFHHVRLKDSLCADGTTPCLLWSQEPGQHNSKFCVVGAVEMLKWELYTWVDNKGMGCNLSDKNFKNM